MTTPRECEIVLDINPNGTGSITIDGVDWSNRVSRVEFEARANKTTDVTLTICAANVRVLGSAWVTTKLLVLDDEQDAAVEQGTT